MALEKNVAHLTVIWEKILITKMQKRNMCLEYPKRNIQSVVYKVKH